MDTLVGYTRNPMVALWLSKGVDGMGELTREHELGIQVVFLVVYIFKGTNKEQIVSHTCGHIPGQMLRLPEDLVGEQGHMMLTKGHLTKQQGLSTRKESHDTGIAHICTRENAENME